MSDKEFSDSGFGLDEMLIDCIHDTHSHSTDDPMVPLLVDFGVSVITSRNNRSIESIIDCVTATTVTEAVIDDSETVSDSVVESALPVSDVTDSGGQQLVSEALVLSAVKDDVRDDDTVFRLVVSETETLCVALTEFSEHETRLLPEFFDQSQRGKSPESYVKIRNHFIIHWKQTKPKRFSYKDLLSKVSHQRLGNVTAFSRVQKFLEFHKVINTEILTKYDHKKHLKSVKQSLSETKTRIHSNKKSNKRLNTEVGNDHQMAAQVSADHSLQQSNPKSRTRPNPFKLVPLESYDSESEAPFAVRLSMEALAIIDIHAHCVRTEVIGLLGGRYCARTQQLFILTAEPCASLDDHDLQCDMDPVSQATAKMSLEGKNYCVVGWYHSHPTFVPNPSLRDLETQLNFQQLFTKESNQPFLALILSPYSTRDVTNTCHPHVHNNARSLLVSKFKCLWVSDVFNQQGDYRIPYELIPSIIRREKLVFSVTNKLRDLCMKMRAHPSCIQIMTKVKRFRGHDVTHLDKLCSSLRHYLSETGLSAVECDHMINNCKTILVQTLIRCPHSDVISSQPMNGQKSQTSNQSID